MSYVYANSKRAQQTARHSNPTSAQSPLDALRTGAVQPTQEQTGHRVDLPDAMRAKMESAFGTDLSAVRLYESKAVADAGASAVTRGTDIAFAPGMLDFTSYGGQTLLGHEMSHVVSQQRGEVTGGGFLNDHTLEAKADREGAMAAAGQQIEMPAAAMSSVTAASAAGPMQAKKGEETKPEDKETEWNFAADTDVAYQLPIDEIISELGEGNAQDAGHGEKFQAMMKQLNTLSAVKGKEGQFDQTAYNAMRSNAFAGAISGMEGYRARLKEEKGRYFERRRQIRYLDGILSRAKADQEKGRKRQSTTLDSSEFTGTIRGGAVNQVYRYSRGGAGAYFKPDKGSDEAVKPAEKDVMQQANIYPVGPDGKALNHDPRAGDREIAFSRLGSLLGSSVTIGAKRATMGSGAPTGQTIDGKEFKAEAGQTGVLMEEAPGRAWTDYNWRFKALASDAPGGNYDTNQVLGSQRGDRRDANVFERAKAAGLHFEDATTEGSGFGGREYDLAMERPGAEGSFGAAGETLDVADPDYQRQMNELFLLDTLAGHPDRHRGNFHVSKKEDGKVRVKAIDTDMSFGAMPSGRDADFFGKRMGAINYGGLPAHMQIDANMAQRIAGIDRETLDLTFSDLLKKEEIDALETRFRMMREYIEAQRKHDPDLIVQDWNGGTAKREMLLAGGANSFLNEASQAGGYSGNNYYQRQLLMLNAGLRKNRELYEDAEQGIDKRLDPTRRR